MERLTERTGEGQAIPRMDLKNNGHQKCMERLAEYEDLEEQCAKENSWCLRILLHKWKEFIEDIQELYEYRKAEEQNRLLKLPCAVGDTVYSFSFGKILTLCVDSFVIYTDGIDARLSSKMKEYEFLKIDMDIADFGEKWFSTKEAAEATLKELERG